MKEYWDFMRENSHDLSKNCLLAVVCNIKSFETLAQKYGDFSTDTEFLSDNELEQVIKMASAQEIPFRVFTNEDSFIRYISSPNINLKKIIVYNSAQSGTGAGRKALIPGLCNYYHIRHTGSDAYRVSLCRDKFAIAAILGKLGISIPKSHLFINGNIDVELDKNQKYIAKPIYESASIGIKKENVFLGSAIPFRYLRNLEKTMQQPLIVQEFIYGYEIEVPVLAGEKSYYAFSPVVLHRFADSLIMGNDILDYDKIYNDAYHFSSLPDFISDNPIKQTACKVAEKLCLSGLCRVDFRLKKDLSFFVTDVSTNPHFISHSSVNFAFKQLGLNDRQLFHTILALS